jgi:hypothetical protein
MSPNKYQESNYETFYCVVCDNISLTILHCLIIAFLKKAETCFNIIYGKLLQT